MESAVEDNECEVLFMECIQQFSTVYPEAQLWLLKKYIIILIKSNYMYAIISIVFYHHMFDFSILLLISKFTIPS